MQLIKETEMCQCGTDAPAQGTKDIAQDRTYRQGRYYFLHILRQNLLSYSCYLTQAVTRGLFIGCIGTHAHGHQVTLMFRQSEVIM